MCPNSVENESRFFEVREGERTKGKDGEERVGECITTRKNEK